jgi:hypothetical protein
MKISLTRVGWHITVGSDRNETRLAGMLGMSRYDAILEYLI